MKFARQGDSIQCHVFTLYPKFCIMYLNLIFLLMAGLLDFLPLAGNALQSVGNIIETNQTNNANRDFTVDMYNRQRQDAIADRDFQNNYNSPVEQMIRLTAAGLNPALVYGNGTAAGVQSAPTRSSDPGSYKGTAPQFDASGILQAIMGFYDIHLKEAQTDNLRAAVDVAKAEILQKTAQTDQTRQATGFAAQLQPISIEGARANVNKTIVDTGRSAVDTQVALDANERAAAMQAVNFQSGVESILTARANRANTVAEHDNIVQSLQNLRSTNVLQQLDINLKKLGIQPGDPLWARGIGQIVNNPSSAVKGAQSLLEAIIPTMEKGDMNFMTAKPGRWK